MLVSPYPPPADIFSRPIRDCAPTSQIHSIKKTPTEAGYARLDTEKNERHHADKFGRWRLPCTPNQRTSPPATPGHGEHCLSSSNPAGISYSNVQLYPKTWSTLSHMLNPILGGGSFSSS